MGTQKKKKNTVAKKVVDKKNVVGAGAGAGSATTPEVLGEQEQLLPGTKCAEHIRSIFHRDAERLEMVTRSLPDRVLVDLTSDILKSPDMYPVIVSEEDKVVMGAVERAVLRVRRELFIVKLSRDVQAILDSDSSEAFRILASKAVGLATLLSEGMRGSFSFANWFVDMMIKTQTASKEDLMALKSFERVQMVAIGMYVFIRATHEVYGKERLYFPGNLVVTLRYVYGMFFSHTGTIFRNGSVYCATACLLALGTFGSSEIPAALDEICIPHHERCCVVPPM
jgi:hypothetical protein